MTPNVTKQIVQQEITKNIFKILKDFLTQGTATGSNTVLKITNGPVNYPTQQIHKHVLDLVEDLAEDIDKIIQIVFPDNFGNIADSRLVIKQKGTVIDGTGGDFMSIAHSVF